MSSGNGHRAQASTEYLIILAVVVIVALAVVGVLGGFPTVAKGITEKDSATYWQAGNGIAITRYFANLTGTYGVIRNNNHYTIKLVYASGSGSDISATPFTLAPGESTSTFHLLANNSTAGAFCVSPGSGIYTVPVSNLSFGYLDLQYGTVRNFTGVKPLIGSC